MNERQRWWIDSETTALGPERRPWEVALIQQTNGVLDEIVIVVTDADLSQADPRSLAMNGFHDRHPLGDRYTVEDPKVLYMSEADAADSLEFLLKGCEIVAAQPAFDMEGIAALLRRHGREPNWHYRLRCVESQTAGYLRRDVGGLQDCAKQLGVPVDPAVVHSALGDARLVYECWLRIFRGSPADGQA